MNTMNNMNAANAANEVQQAPEKPVREYDGFVVSAGARDLSAALKYLDVASSDTITFSHSGECEKRVDEKGGERTFEIFDLVRGGASAVMRKKFAFAFVPVVIRDGNIAPWKGAFSRTKGCEAFAVDAKKFVEIVDILSEMGSVIRLIVDCNSMTVTLATKRGDGQQTKMFLPCKDASSLTELSVLPEGATVYAEAMLQAAPFKGFAVGSGLLGSCAGKEEKLLLNIVENAIRYIDSAKSASYVGMIDKLKTKLHQSHRADTLYGVASPQTFRSIAAKFERDAKLHIAVIGMEGSPSGLLISDESVGLSYRIPFKNETADASLYERLQKFAQFPVMYSMRFLRDDFNRACNLINIVDAENKHLRLIVVPGQELRIGACKRTDNYNETGLRAKIERKSENAVEPLETGFDSGFFGALLKACIVKTEQVDGVDREIPVSVDILSAGPGKNVYRFNDLPEHVSMVLAPVALEAPAKEEAPAASDDAAEAAEA